MNRREFIRTMSVALAAGATMKGAYVKVKQEGGRFVRPDSCTECEHFVEGGYQCSGMYGETERDWCDKHRLWIEVDSPCDKGIKLVED